MSIRWIEDGEPHAAEVYNRPLRDYIMENAAGSVPTTRTITTSVGIGGGGSLGADVEIYGVPATTTTIGVSRFATLSEAVGGTAQNIAISPSILSQMPKTGFGVTQRWQNVLYQRQLNSTYTNNTGLPIAVSVSPYDESSTDYIEMWANIDGVEVPIGGYSSAPVHGKSHMMGWCIVPAGSRYRIYVKTRTNVQPSVVAWVEMR